MGGSPFCFHGGSLAVRFLLYLPTPWSPFAYSRSPTDFNTNTILIHHPAATTHQQACNTVTCKPATLPPHLSHPLFPPYHPTSLPHLSHFATSPLSSPPFPPCYLTSLPHLSHLATSPLSPLSVPLCLSALPFPPCHPTSLPTFPTLRPFHLSQLATSPYSYLSHFVTSLPSHLSNLRSSLPSHLLSSLPSCSEI